MSGRYQSTTSFGVSLRSLNSVGESSSASMISLSSEDYGDRNIISPVPCSPTYKSNNMMTLEPEPDSPSLSPLPPMHNYSLAQHITMEDTIGATRKMNRDSSGSRNRTLSESNYHQNRNKQRESFSSVASSTDSAKARVSTRNARNLRRAKSFKNTSRDGSSMGRQSGSASSLNKKPLADTKVSKEKSCVS